MFGDARYLFEQGRGIRALGRLFFSEAAEPSAVPGPVLQLEVPPPSTGLVNRFVQFAGGEPSSYRHVLPPHLFPQWCLPAMLQVAHALPYAKTKVINAGCRLKVIQPLPSGEALQLRAQLLSINDNGHRALIQIGICTGSASVAQALEAEVSLHVPLEGARVRAAARREKPRVPEQAVELRTQRLRSDAGRRFACLTGDINPIHWLSPYARAAGFRNCILHGFGSFALTFEGLVRTLFAGDPTRLAGLSATFTRPLTLPASVRLYQHEREVFLGDAPGGAVYLSGEFQRAVE